MLQPIDRVLAADKGARMPHGRAHPLPGGLLAACFVFLKPTAVSEHMLPGTGRNVLEFGGDTDRFRHYKAFLAARGLDQTGRPLDGSAAGRAGNTVTPGGKIKKPRRKRNSEL
eukprot:SAG22_NODE_1081_length_5654_cov_4.719352_2_plen_113_part_00